jgi:hypothetical protein
LNRKANWEKPVPKNKAQKNIKFFLKEGGTEIIVRPNKPRNFLWKYSKPLKYYFTRLFVISQKLKEKELQSKSNKWRTEEKISISLF